MKLKCSVAFFTKDESALAALYTGLKILYPLETNVLSREHLQKWCGVYVPSDQLHSEDLLRVDENIEAVLKGNMQPHLILSEIQASQRILKSKEY